MADSLRLVLMTFPQHWDGSGTLTLNVLALPSGDPVSSPLIGTSTPFAKGSPTFSVVINPGFDALPSSTGPGAVTLTPTVISAAAAPEATFALLSSAVTSRGSSIGTAPAMSVPRIRKPLPPSYIAAGGGAPDGVLTTTEDEFGCGLRGVKPTPINPALKTIGWGEIISYALRQPMLAIKMGLLYRLSVTLPAAEAQVLAQGGYVSAVLAAGDPWAIAGGSVAGSIRTHASRVPPLNGSARAVFAAFEFPINSEGGTFSQDSFREAGIYSDGFAKLVHCSQPMNSAAAVGDGVLPPSSDLGIEIGWDDEQVVEWQNNQIQLMNARASSTGLSTTAILPLGVLGYRVDVADVTPAAEGGPLQTPVWESLCDVTSTLPGSLGTFEGDLTLEPTAAQPYNTAGSADAWLPRYFANWRGGSLCEPDPIPNALTNPKAAPTPSTRQAQNLTTLLSYGHTYSFRVRLGDLSSGGPMLADTPINPGPAAVATQLFQRQVAPKAPSVVQMDANGNVIAFAPPPPPPLPSQPPTQTLPVPPPSTPASLVVMRPLIVYPEVLYTHLGDEAGWRDTIRTTLVAAAKTAVATAGGPAGIAGLPDPDVASVVVEVLVRNPLNGIGTEDGQFVLLYTSTFALNATTGDAPVFMDPGTTIPIEYIDASTLVSWAEEQTGGTLLIPRGRDVRITIRSVIRTGEPAYFGAQAEQGMAATLLVRAEPLNEPALLGQADAFEPVSGYFFRRPDDVSAPPVLAQFATQLGVASTDDALTAPPGMRVVFGASLALKTQISNDGATLTFASTSELLRFWVIAIVVDMERDWSWDGLQTPNFTVLRGGPTDTEATAISVGTFTVPKIVGASAILNPDDVNLSRTRLIYLDAVDPHMPEPAGFPVATSYRWFVKPNRTAAGPALPSPVPEPVINPAAPAPFTGTEIADTALDLELPITVPPTQVPAIASVGLALSPYAPGPLYASTAARQRSLWVELTEPIANAVGDALFARVLAHGADPLLWHPGSPRTLDGPDSNPPLSIDPELMTVVIPGDTDDRNGITAMTQLTQSPTSNVHFLLPLPPGVDADSAELFDFWTYELRIGHAGPAGDSRWWSTANGRFGTALRVVGVQHPAPTLPCHAGRVNVPAAAEAGVLAALTASGSVFQMNDVLDPIVPLTTPTSGTPSLVVATAPYAIPTLNGTILTNLPTTQLWFLLYAQTVQADGRTMRNVLVAAEQGVSLGPNLKLDQALTQSLASWTNLSDLGTAPAAAVVFHQALIEAILKSVHLSPDSSLSMMAVELLPGGSSGPNPNVDFGITAEETSDTYPFSRRILRASPLVAVAPFC